MIVYGYFTKKNHLCYYRALRLQFMHSNNKYSTMYRYITVQLIVTSIKRQYSYNITYAKAS